MSNRIQQIKRIIAKNVLTPDFRKTTDSIWYSFKNDIVIYTVMECPSNIIHVWFGFLPLFMPPLEAPGFMLFGSRIRRCFNDLNEGPFQSDDDLSILRWCEKAKRHIQDEALPAVESISTVSKMYSFWNNEISCGGTHLIRGDEIFVTQLLMYASVYLNKSKEAMAFAEHYLSCIKQRWNSDYVKQAKTEVEQIKKMLGDEEIRKQVFDKWRWKNMANYDRKMREF